MSAILRLLLGLALLAIGPRALAQPAPDPPPPAPSESDAAAAAAAALEPGKGMLVIKARPPAGAILGGSSVLIDGKPMGGLEDGEATFANVPEGPHAVVVEAAGFRRFTQSVTVRGGERAQLEALLIVQPVERAARAAVWKWSLATSLVMMATGGAYMYYSHGRMVSNLDAIRVTAAFKPDGVTLYNDPVPIQSNECGFSADRIVLENHAVVVNQDRFERACTWKGRTAIGGAVAGVGVLLGFASVVLLTRETGQAPPPTFIGNKRELAIVPTVTPDGAGASLSFRW